MPPPLRLVHSAAPTQASITDDDQRDDDVDDETLGGVFGELSKEIHRVLVAGRGTATSRSLGGVLLRLAALREDYEGVAMPSPADRT